MPEDNAPAIINPPIVNMAIRVLLIFIFIFNVAAGLYIPIIAIYITQHIVGATVTVLGFSVAIYAIIKSIFQLPIARKLDSSKGETDDFKVLMIGIIMAIFYSVGFMFINTVFDFYVLQIFTGIADACTMAAYYAIFSHHIDKDSQGFEWSLFSIGGLTISAAIGGILGGYIASEYGFNVVFILAASFNVIAAILLVLLFPYVKNFRQERYLKKLKIGW